MRVLGRQRHGTVIEGSLPVIDSGYRLGPRNQNGDPASARWPDAVGLSWAALLIGLLPVVTAVARGGAWGAEPTVGLVLSCLGAVGLGRYYTCAAHAWAQRRTRRRGLTS